MKAPKIESNYEQLEAGNYMARLFQIIYIGTVPVEWQGEEKLQYKVRFSFEFPTEKKVFKEENGEQPYILSTELTLSMSPKSRLRPMVESWLGKKMTDSEAIDFDIDELLGREAMVNVVHKEANNGNVYANISTVSPLMKGSKCPEAINEMKILGYQNWDEELFQSLPEFIRNRMVSSTEYQAMRKHKPEEIEDRNDDSAKEEMKLEADLEDLPF